MQALELQEYKKLVLRTMEIPRPAHDEVLVRVRSVGICGSDIHGYDGQTGRRIPPVVMGHEAAGEVVETGASGGRFAPGDRVTFDSTLNCGECFYCSRGQINLCTKRRVLGVSCDEYRQNGAFAEYVVVPERGTYRLPNSVSFDHGAMVEPVSIAVHAVNLTPRCVGDSVLVVGAGLIGLLTVQVLRNAGFGPIFVSDVAESRLVKARELGADVALNARETDVVSEILAQTDGLGVAASLDAVGSQASVDTAIYAVRRAGTVTLIGNVSPSIAIPLQHVVNRQLTLQGSCASSGEYPACLDLIERGAIDLDTMISERIPLHEGAECFERLYQGAPDVFKVIMHP
ncbi:MAG: galactitol-1-phosphate 5-dehydrogenase [Spirochaetaceae bacterium]|nr:MAG: galactitol-1-phosphate 5-dehydrogenase [Spirochaetaceae bacterium]